MNGKFVLVASSAVMAVAGLGATFAPAELLGTLGVAAPGAGVVVVQLLGALYLGFAFVNWTAKENAIGGIYSRPISLGNLTHFAIGALALVKFEMAGPRHPLLLGAALVYVALAVMFAALVFGLSPVSAKA